MNITLVMSSSITTTLIMAVGPTVGPAVAYSKLVLVRMNVPVSFPLILSHFMVQVRFYLHNHMRFMLRPALLMLSSLLCMNV